MGEKVKCRLCERFYDDKEMSDEHYPAHSVGNDDIIGLDFIKLMDTLVGENQDFNKTMNEAASNGDNLMKVAEKYFDQNLAKDLYPKGRTARTLCRRCNTFLGKYDEAYKKFYLEDGNPKKVKGFQFKTRLQIVKAIYAKFLSIPETQNEQFDFLDFIRDEDATEYTGIWRLYFIKRDHTTDIMSLSDIPTGKMDWDMDGKKIIYELSDDKFIYNLMNFDKHDEFEMNSIFDILEKNYKLVVGCNDESGGYHGQMQLCRVLKEVNEMSEELKKGL